MTTIQLNGQPHALAGPTSITTLLDANGYGGRAVAVEVNREIVPKSQHGQRLVHDGDRIEVVHAMGGG